MTATAHIARLSRQPSILYLLWPASKRWLVGVLNKIFSAAFYLFAMRALSAIGFMIALWLCPIHVFANLGMYLAALSLAAIVVFGRYELLIIGARDERRCATAFHLCIIFGSTVIITALVFGFTVIRPFVAPHFVILFGCALFARAWLRLGLVFATRHGRYNRAVKALLPHTIGQPLALVQLLRHGYDPLIAFMLSDIVGHLIAAACVCASEWTAFQTNSKTKAHFSDMWAMARDNFRLPTINLTAAASAFSFAVAPLFLLPAVPNGILAGTLAMLFRILDLPTALTIGSVGPILMKEVADRNGPGNRSILRGIFLLPAAIAVGVFGLISLGGFTLNSLHIIPSWHVALTVLPVVALFQASIAATSPLIDIAALTGRQKGLVALNVFSAGLAALVLLTCSSDLILAILVAGAIGFSRVIAMLTWLVGFPPPRIAALKTA